jgi:N-glycosylase/DNA lyase
MFEIKIFQRSNASLVETRVFDNMSDALENYNATGSGEGYWTEMRQVFDGYTVTKLCSD